jgi:hypothetical protein
MVKLDLEDLADGAEIIIIGQVENIRCEWGLDQGTIYTIASLRIMEILKGHPNDRNLVIQIPGGTIGELSLSVSDMPDFGEQEDVLVFLRAIPDPDNNAHSMTVVQGTWPSYTVYGQAQGKYSIDSQGIAEKGGYSLVSSLVDPDRILPLDELKLRIHETLVRISRERE